jgi:hypothetical protein
MRAVEQRFAHPGPITTIKRLGSALMANAHYHRMRAQLCLQLAGVLTDPAAAAGLVAEAATHLAEADNLEAQRDGSSPSHRKAGAAVE